MSMTDPIADLLTRIRNAQSAGKPTVGMGARSEERRVAYFFAILRRFFSRMSIFVLAMGYYPTYGTES